MDTPLQALPAWIEGQARVVAVHGAVAQLVAERPAGCGGCASKSACGSGRAAPAKRQGWQVPREVGAGQAALVLGELLRVGVDRQALTRATLAAYALPLGAMLAGAVGARPAGDSAAAAAAVAGLGLGVVAARRLLRRWQHALAPVVLGRVAPAAAGCTDGAGQCTPAPGAAQAIATQHRRP